MQAFIFLMNKQEDSLVCSSTEASLTVNYFSSKAEISVICVCHLFLFHKSPK